MIVITLNDPAGFIAVPGSWKVTVSVGVDRLCVLLGRWQDVLLC